MDTTTPDPTDPLTPPPDEAETTPAPDPNTPAESIEEHAAQFEPEARRSMTPEAIEARREQAAAQRRDDGGKFQEGRRRRAQSQQASADDVPRIRELTKKLRTVEDELKALKAPKPPAPPAKADEPKPFLKAEPKREEFYGTDDPETHFLRSLTAFDREKAAHEQAMAQAKAKAEAQEAQAKAEYEQWLQHTAQTYQEKVRAFEAETPDFKAVMAKVPAEPVTPLLAAVLLADDNGPAIAYHLAKHPALYDEVQVLTASSPVTAQTVAHLQRMLHSRREAAKTGSAPARPTYTPPKPPNPVRTGSVQTLDEPPGEGASIADHARYYGPQRR